jgi:hypothetical protein
MTLDERDSFRKKWVVEEARAMCEKLDYALPLVIFGEEKLFGMATRIRVVPNTASQKPFRRSVDPDELRISETFLAESSDALVRHSLAVALVLGDPVARKRMMNRALIRTAIPMLPAAIAWIVVGALTKSNLWTGLSVAALVVAFFPLAMKLQGPLINEPWLKAIELSGETETALAMLTGQPKPDPKWVPAFFSRWAQRQMEDRRNYIETEAIKRGLLMSREDR